MLMSQRDDLTPWRMSAALAPVLLLTLALAPLSALSDAGKEEWPDWADEPDLMDQVAAVSEGELRFLPAAAADGKHAHLNRIRITEQSLDEGWVVLEQCHENIDAVPAAQILFRDGGIRHLSIESSRNIRRAWVEGHSVQLEGVGPDASLCLRAQSRALQHLGDGVYRLRNGPYMRRFLDGYYPMRVRLDIQYPAELVQVFGQSPGVQPGFSVKDEGASLSVDTRFEGRLVTCFYFCRRDGQCAEPLPACEES